MALERDRKPVGVGQPGIGCEGAGQVDRRVRRQAHHLVLVRGRDGDGFSGVHPGLAPFDVIAVQADRPPLGRLDHLATEGLGHDLVAETDADQGRLALGLAQEIRQRRDPGQGVIDPRRRAGDQEGLLLVHRLGQDAVGHVIGRGQHRIAQQRLEHRRIVAEPLAKACGRGAGLKDAEFHDRLDSISAIRPQPQNGRGARSGSTQPRRARVENRRSLDQ